MIQFQISLFAATIRSWLWTRQSITQVRFGAGLVALAVITISAIDPAMATTAGEGSVDVCDTDVAALFNNFMLLMSGLAPLGTGAFVSWHMFRAGTTSKSDKTKQHRESITQAIVYGAGATLVFGLLALGSGLIPGGVACV